MCLTVEKIPVVDAIFYITIILQDFGEKFTKEVIIGRLFKSKLPNIIEIDRELLCRRVSRFASTPLGGRHIPGKPSHSSLIGVVCFFSPIFSYFCLFVAALRPCHGRLPRKKYMKTWPRASRSSRRDCSSAGSHQLRYDRS